MLAGDVSRAVLHGAPCAVAVAPRDYRRAAHPIRTIGVGFDDSREAQAALDLGATLARELEAQLRCWSAAPAPAPYLPGFAAGYDQAEAHERRRVLAVGALKRATENLPVATESEMVAAPPGEALEELSRHVGCSSQAPADGARAPRRARQHHRPPRHHAACPLIVVPGPVAIGDEAGAAEDSLAHA